MLTLHKRPRLSALLALALLVPVPSIGVVGAMWLWPDTTLGTALFALAKVWILLLPVLWHVIVDRKKARIPRPSSRGMLAACVTGAMIFLIIAVGYWLIGRELIDADFVREQLTAMGVATPLMYIALAVYWCTLNSLLEEYVWRWFVYTKCEALMPRAGAVLASAFFFTVHHMVSLAVYFDWRVVVLASIGVFIGGATWSWLYLRYRNIYACYVSHVFADIIIFAIGWMLLN